VPLPDWVSQNYGRKNRTRKSRSQTLRRLIGVLKPAVSHSIDTLRDGMSFPGSCGEDGDIGVVGERVKPGQG